MLWLIIIIISVGIDQIVKFVIESKIKYGSSIPVIENFFYLSHHKNSGAAWSFLSEYDWSVNFFIVVTSIVCVILIYFLFKAHHRLLNFSLSLLIGGAIGNLIDRIVKGNVTDFIEFHFGSYIFPVFNIADMCVVIGTIFLAIYMLFVHKEPEKEN